MKNLKEKISYGFFLSSAIICIICVILICIFLFFHAIPTLLEIGFFRFIFHSNWNPSNGEYGILSMIISSIYIAVIATFISAIIGIFSAIYLVYFCPKNLSGSLCFIINVLAGIPSVVFGFFGLMVLVPFIQHLFNVNGSNLLTASILLAIMILPTIISISKDALYSVPKSYFEASLALGCSKEYSIFYILLPAAKSGILTSLILGISRVIGESMAVIIVSGNQTLIPTSIFDGIRTLSSNIILEMGYASGLHYQALIATAFILFLLTLFINLLFTILRNKK